MIEEVKGSSGTPVDEASGPKQETQTVSYHSYQKALNEKKSFQSKAHELQSQIDEITTRQLNEQGDYKKLVELRDQEIKKLSEQTQNALSEKEQTKKSLQDTFKLQAFYNNLPGQIKKQQYLDFVDLDSIVLDPETNRVDESSVKNTVSKFMEEYSDLVQTKPFKGLPSDAPKGAKEKKPTEQEAFRSALAHLI